MQENQIRCQHPRGWNRSHLIKNINNIYSINVRYVVYVIKTYVNQYNIVYLFLRSDFYFDLPDHHLCPRQNRVPNLHPRSRLYHFRHRLYLQMISTYQTFFQIVAFDRRITDIWVYIKPYDNT